MGMMLLAKGQNNVVALTLTEKCTLANPVFLFEFKSKTTNTLAYCIAPDTSAYTRRYNLFTITETTTPDNLNAEIELLEGEYSYKVYEQTSSTNLDPNLSTGMVESGIAKVTGTAGTVVEYDPSQTIAVYES